MIPELKSSQRRSAKVIADIRRHIRRRLPTTKSYVLFQILLDIMKQRWSWGTWRFSNKLVEKIINKVVHCAAVSKISTDDVLRFLSGVIDYEKFISLMHCSCSCRHQRRDALRRRIESTNNYTPSPLPTNCRCCARHRKP